MGAIIENMNSPDYVLYTPSFGNFQGKIQNLGNLENYKSGGVYKKDKSEERFFTS